MSDDHPDSQSVVRLHLWLERGGETLMGLGRIQLLERVESEGSLKKAAESLGMSYRAAWGKIKASEESLGLPLLGQAAAGRNGSCLTAPALAMVRAFRQWYAEVEAFALARGGEIFPFPLGAFSESPAQAAGEARGIMPPQPLPALAPDPTTR